MKNILDFLTELAQNNNSAWFAAHKVEYQAAKNEFEKLCAAILAELSLLYGNFSFVKPKDCMFRINRDVRFSKNKAPYKNCFSAYFAEGGKKSAKQGFYLQIEPQQSFLGGGAFDTSPEMLYKLRQEISYEPEKFKKVLENKKFRQCFPELLGKQLKTAPKGYEKDHPQIELLRFTQLYVLHRYEDEDIQEESFVDLFITHCQLLKPFADLLDETFLF